LAVLELAHVVAKFVIDKLRLVKGIRFGILMQKVAATRFLFHMLRVSNVTNTYIWKERGKEGKRGLESF